jgi:hypothetical protein
MMPNNEVRMVTLSNFTLPGILFLLTLVFGFWLSHAGKPYNGLLINVHKLIALSVVVLMIFQLSKILKSTDPVALITVLLIVAAVCVVAVFASGGLMSAGVLDYSLMLIIHRVSTPVLMIVLALASYFLVKQG